MASNNLKSEALFKKLKLIKVDQEIHSFCSNQSLKLPLVFVCPDSLRFERAITWLTSSIDRFKNSEVVNYYANELNSKKAITVLLENLKFKSLFQTEKIIIIKNAKKLKASSMEQIINTVEQGLCTSLLILVCDDLSAALKKVGTSVIFEDFSSAKLSKWIKKEFSEYTEKEISAEVISYLVRSFNGSLTQLSSSIARICLINDEIELESVKKEFSKSTEANSFELFNSIANKNVESSEMLLRTIFRQGMHPLAINSFLGRCYRTLVSQTGSKELSNPWFARKVHLHRNKFNQQQLKHSLNIISELDFALKDSGIGAEDTMSNAILRLCLRQKKAARI